MTDPDGRVHVDVYWLPLGTGDNTHCVRTNGRVFEAVSARLQGRPAQSLYHSALVVRLGEARFSVEMGPAWGGGGPHRGVVATGPVGVRQLGRSRLFRYEVRCGRDVVVPDLDACVGGPRPVPSDLQRATRLLALTPHFPTATWGLDELGTGDMWNSNSLVSWLLASSGHSVRDVGPPPGGRAPGWAAGLAVAARSPDPAPGPAGAGTESRHDPLPLHGSR